MTTATASNCPICQKPSRRDYQPFCSRRCADVDLGRWLNESYALPGDDLEVTEDAPSADDDRGC